MAPGEVSQVILVDTSVWIDFFRGAATPEADRLAKAFSLQEDLCVCGPILMEILQGIVRPADYHTTNQLLQPLLYLPLRRKTYHQAAALYRIARSRGKIIRNSLDCLIAACAMEHKVPLLQKDRDYAVLASLFNLNLLKS
jgi:predicted nucleic acid-binding protein